MTNKERKPELIEAPLTVSLNCQINGSVEIGSKSHSLNDIEVLETVQEKKLVTTKDSKRYTRRIQIPVSEAIEARIDALAKSEHRTLPSQAESLLNLAVIAYEKGYRLRDGKLVVITASEL